MGVLHNESGQSRSRPADSPDVPNPGDYYEPDVQEQGEVITLRRLPPPRKRWTREEVLRAHR